MSKLVLIDGNAIMHRAYHAIPPTLTSRTGDPINAVYGFTSMLLRIITEINPTHLAICFDRKEPTFRHLAFEKYQSQRPKMDDDLSSQFKLSRAVSDAFGIPVYDKAGYEADDLIGTIANKFAGSIDSVIIVTGDRDILQLVNDKVSVYLPTKGISEAKLLGVEGVIEKMGVKPNQIIDYKALIGDSSDNYPGVSGVGPKTAYDLLLKYEDFNNIYKNLDELPERVRAKLVQGKKMGELSYKLAEIKKDVPVKLDLKDVSRWSIRRPEIITLFKSIGFRSLRERVEKMIVDEDKKRQLNLL